MMCARQEFYIPSLLAPTFDRLVFKRAGTEPPPLSATAQLLADTVLNF